MGHREEKQSARRQRIIANAVALYRDAGPEALRVREVCARSGISEATFFNYFGSLDSVFREWAEDAIDAAFRRAAERGQAGEGVRRAMRGLSLELATEVVEQGLALVKGLRSIAAAPRSASTTPARGRALDPDGASILIELALARGEFRSDVDAAQLAELLRCVVVSALAGGVDVDRAPATAALARRIRLAADVVLDGMRKRNERVTLHSNPSTQPTI